LRAAM